MQQKLVVNGPSTPSQAAAKLQLDDIIFFNSYASILVMMRTINSCDMPAAAAASNRTETVGPKNWVANLEAEIEKLRESSERRDVIVCVAN